MPARRTPLSEPRADTCLQADVVAIFGADTSTGWTSGRWSTITACGADATIAALPVPVADARGFGVIEAARTAGYATSRRSGHAGNDAGPPEIRHGSMGIYLFSTDVLLDALQQPAAAARTSAVTSCRQW